MTTQPAQPASPVPVPFAEFRSHVLSLYQPPLRARATLKKMLRALDLLGSVPGVATTADLTHAALCRFVAMRGPLANPNTTISELRAVRAACNLAIDEGWLDASPFRPRRPLVRKRRPARKTHHSIEEVSLLLEHLRVRATTWPGWRLYALGATVAYTGLRKMEALHLQLEDVDLSAGLLDVSGRRRLKTEESEAPVPIPPHLAEILAAWLPMAGPVYVFPGEKRRGPWTGGLPGFKPLDRLAEAGRRCDLAGLTFHSLRHSLATHLAGKWGLSAEQVRLILRHSSCATTQGYYIHRDRANLVESVRDVSYRITG